MDETLIDVIGIITAIIIMLVVPLLLVSERADDISQLLVQTATAEFVDEVIKTGQITSKRYQQLVSALGSSGNTYDIDIEVKILDENSAKKVVDEYGSQGQVGNNTYYSIFTTQIEEKIRSTSDESGYGRLVLKQGDEISVTVKNNNKTLAQSLKKFYYNATQGDIHIIAATATGTIAINGKTSEI